MGIRQPSSQVSELSTSAGANNTHNTMKEQTRFVSCYSNMTSSCYDTMKAKQSDYDHDHIVSRSESDDVTKELRAAFSFFDRNCNGVIEMDELEAAMKSLGYVVSDKELRMMIGEVDVDGNGKIDFDEFVRMMNNATKIDKREGVELREAFKVFDVDGNGVITRSELKMVMKNLGENLTEQDLNEMMLEADKNGDGVVDFDEFVEVVDTKWG